MSHATADDDDDVSADVCMLQLQLVMGTMKNEGNKDRMDAGNDSTMAGGGR